MNMKSSKATEIQTCSQITLQDFNELIGKKEDKHK